MISHIAINKSHISLSLLALSMFSVGIAQAATIFVPANQPIGYAAQPVMSGYNIGVTGASIYRGEYEKGTWSGNLSCYPVDSLGAVDLAAPCWSGTIGTKSLVGAQSKVDNQPLAGLGQRYIGTLASNGTKVPFLWTSLSTSYAAALVSANNVNYIRGDRSQEPPAGTLRARTSALGDTIHSRPNYWTDGVNPTVFYGGNDGMLHAIDATPGTGGSERWAYVPSMLIPKLSKLWTGGYTHEYYVDGNTYIASISGGKTILAGVLGAGGKGIYALDISSLVAGSDQNAANKILWEITPTSLTNTSKTTQACPGGAYCNLGDTYSNPIIAKVQSGQDAVIVGNGYNNAGNGHATLFILNAIDGTVIKEIDTGSGSLASPNGLSSPVAIDASGDNLIDTVYAGDIDGNLWKFDLNTYTAKLLYKTGQSITSAPTLQQHPNGGYMVNFGTGRMLTAADATDTGTYSVYGIWDGAPASNTKLVTQTITERNYIPTAGATSTFRTRNATANPLNWNAGGDLGWVAALPASNGVGGERVVGDNVSIQSRRFYFNGTNPNIKFTPAGMTTPSGLGENWLMELNYLTGGSPNDPPKDINAPFFDMDGNGLFDDADRIKYTAGIDTLPVTSPATTYGMPILPSWGLPVGYMTTNGVQSQPMVAAVGSYSVTFYNQNPDIAGAPTTTTTPSSTGIGGGHFDVDMWYNGVWGSGSIPNTHDHEYDKIYDTNGLNFLNPNKTDKRLSLAVGATTPYKVLMMNQSWNRAILLTLGKNIWSSKDYLTGPYQTLDPVTGLDYNPMVGGYNSSYAALWTPGATGVGALNMSTLPTYTGNSSSVVTFTQAGATAPTPLFNKITVNTVKTTGSIGCGGILNGKPLFTTVPPCNVNSVTTGVRQPDAVDGVGGFEFSMPSTAFQLLDWWNDGVVQTGVMPTAPQCPDNSNKDGTEPANGTKQAQQYIGALGERNDGVLTVQVVKDTTPDACVELNAHGRPDLGFRVVDAYSASCTPSATAVVTKCGGKKQPTCDTPITDYVYAEYVVYWHHPYGTCYGDTTSTWKTANNDGDPWWPTQESGNNPDLVGKTTFGTNADGTPARCGPGNGNSNPAWINTTPPDTWATPPAAWTTPPGWPPKGFTMTPPLDTADTLPLCPVYSKTADDPRTASFVASSPGTTGGVTTTTCGGTGQPTCPVVTTTVANGLGGATKLTGSVRLACGGLNQPACCGGAGQAACSPCGGPGQSPCTKSCTGCGGANQPACLSTSIGVVCCGAAGEVKCAEPCIGQCNEELVPTRTGRVSWHELINQ
ncbi:MAG: PilC/PilY family type IV pilus protein [Gallionella sp.]|nr:PilC/PilY family type IV pilus protein [Gallionella sp.]